MFKLKLLNFRTISLRSILVTPNTSEKLAKLQRNVKLETFFITKMTEALEPTSFCKFVRASFYLIKNLFKN